MEDDMTRPQQASYFLTALAAGAWVALTVWITPYLAGLFLVFAP
jgi:hypothetical protein